VEFIACGNVNCDASLVNVVSFTDAVTFQDCKAAGVQGRNGAFVVSNTEKRIATFSNCEFSFGSFAGMGWICAGKSGANERVVALLDRCDIINSQSGANGAINGYGPKLQIENSDFSNLTVTVNTEGHAAFINFKEIYASPAELIIRRCDMNNAKLTLGKSPTSIAVSPQTTVSESIITMEHTSFYWNAPFGQKRHWIYLVNTKQFFLSSVTIKVGSQSAACTTNYERSVIFTKTAIDIYAENSYFEVVECDSYVSLFSLNGRAVFVNCTTLKSGVAIRVPNTDGFSVTVTMFYCTIKNCVSQICYGQQPSELLFVRCIVTNEISNTNSFFRHANTKATFECSCIWASGGRVLASDSSVVNIDKSSCVYLSSEGSLGSTTAESCLTCVSKCATQGTCSKVLITGGTLVDYVLEDCTWQDFDSRAVYTECRSLAVRRCEFKNCGSLELDGGCIYLSLFTEKTDLILEQVGLSHVKKNLAGGMSYGMQKRLELARVLVAAPSLLLLDEPTAGMNDVEAGELMEFVHKIKEESDISVIIIEHNMKVMMAIAQRILVLDVGKKIAEGTPEEIQNNKQVIKAYLGEDEV
jgi:ABC-type sugar transport system ATPase subunit